MPRIRNDADRHLAPLVFLDFDDVICINAPYGAYDIFAPDPPDDIWALLFHAPAVETLRDIVEEFDPRFIITSSWLRLMERGGFERLFVRCGLQFVADRLHDAWEAPQAPYMSRLLSIQQWLARHHRGESFVVLDDAMSGTGLCDSRLHAQGRVILCQVNEGLHPGYLPEVRRALRNQGGS